MLEATEGTGHVDELPDTELASAAAAGEGTAFEELYRRNVPAAWRIAHAVAGNRDDASDAVADAFERVFRAVTTGRLSESAAFRPYLLTATRRAAIDISKRSDRTQPTGEADSLDSCATAAEPQERIVADLESRLLVQAFRELPERWRSVLWLVEVEELSADEAAEVLGLTPNNVAQLAVRARIGLRKRYAAAHVREGSHPECKLVIERLGAYVEGALGDRRAAKVDHHLTSCPACRQRREELEEVGVTLRRSALPIPVGLGALAAAGWRAAGAAHSPGVRSWVDSLRHMPARMPRVDPAVGWLSNAVPDLTASASAVERLVSWATAGVLVLGVSVGAVRVGSDGGVPPASSAAGATQEGIAGPVMAGGIGSDPAGSDARSSTPAPPPGGIGPAGATGTPAAAGGLPPVPGPAGSGGAPGTQAPVDAAASLVPTINPVADLLPASGVVKTVASSVAPGGAPPTLPVPAVAEVASEVLPDGPVELPVGDVPPPVLGAPLELPPLTVPDVTGRGSESWVLP